MFRASVRVQVPSPGSAQPWVDEAVSAGIKGRPRSLEKMEIDYGGHAKKLKDLARITLVYSNCARMARVVGGEMDDEGLVISDLKNRFLYPTALGYSDLNACVTMALNDGTKYIAEVQLNHPEMIAAKKRAHRHYEVIREKVPALCQGTAVDAATLEAFLVSKVMGQTSFDIAYAELMAKTSSTSDVLLLAEELEAIVKQGREIELDDLAALPVAHDKRAKELGKAAAKRAAAKLTAAEQAMLAMTAAQRSAAATAAAARTAAERAADEREWYLKAELSTAVKGAQARRASVDQMISMRTHSWMSSVEDRLAAKRAEEQAALDKEAMERLAAEVAAEYSAASAQYDAWGRPGRTHADFRNWCTGAPLEERAGVKVSAAGHVVELGPFDKVDLDNSPGLVPAFASPNLAWTHLARLTVTACKMHGTLEPLWACTALTMLTLSNNKLTGTLEPLQGCLALVELRLDVNRLGGTLQPLAKCTALKDVALGKNKFTGTLQPLQACTALQTLSLTENQFTGSLGALVKLQESLYQVLLCGNNFSPGLTERASLLRKLGANNFQIDN